MAYVSKVKPATRNPNLESRVRVVYMGCSKAYRMFNPKNGQFFYMMLLDEHQKAEVVGEKDRIRIHPSD